MQYKNSQKIIIDKRKLDLLIRLGCPDSAIISMIKDRTFNKTGDQLIDETLECLVDVKDFGNWGGNHNPKGKNQYTKVNDFGQVDHQLAGQVCGQVVDKDKDRDIYIKGDCKGGKQKVLIDEYFNFGDCEEVRDIGNKYDMRVLDNLHRFLVNTFMGQRVDVAFIEKQAERFANGN